MSHNPDNYQIVPAPIEPIIRTQLESQCVKYGLHRNKLVRMLVKFGLLHIADVISNGDPTPIAKSKK